MSLIEVLVAMLIFSLGLLGMVGLQAQGAKISTESEDRGRAALLANEIVSEMWTSRTLALPQGVLDRWTARLTADGGLPIGTIGTVGPPTVIDGVQVVQVTIQWRSPARPSTDQPSTYVTQVAMP